MKNLPVFLLDGVELDPVVDIVLVEVLDALHHLRTSHHPDSSDLQIGLLIVDSMDSDQVLPNKVLDSSQEASKQVVSPEDLHAMRRRFLRY